jgi:hypothetical protein
VILREINLLKARLGEPLLDPSEIDINLLMAAAALKEE